MWGRHVIFYLETKTGIDIARVLHDSMDFPKQFFLKLYSRLIRLTEKDLIRAGIIGNLVLD